MTHSDQSDSPIAQAAISAAATLEAMDSEEASVMYQDACKAMANLANHLMVRQVPLPQVMGQLHQVANAVICNGLGIR